ncbi:MAG: NAD(P)-dependent oxidoreductase [Chloroflexi bacterium]|nr:NAD(P)-dependent oxidoreductase [Chloroflexota bacterium]
MSIRTVAILSPGDMGHAVGRALGEHGIDVVTCLQGRSERTRDLARRASIKDIPSLEELVARADLVLSIVVPSEALNLAQRVAEALRARGVDIPFADCNAISPRTAQEIDAIITAAGGRFIDASIIGGPPKGNQSPRFYASGPDVECLAELDGKGIQVRPIGDRVGRASGLKMCYAALTKGTSALHLALLATAEILGLSPELANELASSQPDAYRRMKGQLPRLPANARRWVGEMEEIAATFAQAGLTPYLHRGAAEVFRRLGQTALADETPETSDTSRTLEQTIAIFAQTIQGQPGGEP